MKCTKRFFKKIKLFLTVFLFVNPMCCRHFQLLLYFKPVLDDMEDL